MHRICFRTRTLLRFPRPRYISSSQSQSPPPSSYINNQNDDSNAGNSQNVPTPITHRNHRVSALSPTPPSRSRASAIALSAAVVSAVVASVALLSSQQKSDHDGGGGGGAPNPLEQAAQRSADSLGRIFHHAKRTGAAAAVLWQSLRSVLSSANHEVRSGFEIRVAALLADIAAANSGRRAALVGAGGGAVVDWLLESVAAAKDGGGTQAESARALAYLIADPNVSAAVLGRPHAIPNLLRFIFSCQPRRSKNKKVTNSV